MIHAWGSEYVYEVREIISRINPSDLTVLGSENLDWITLLTCQGYDPIQDEYEFRFAVKAMLIRNLHPGR